VGQKIRFGWTPDRPVIARFIFLNSKAATPQTAPIMLNTTVSQEPRKVEWRERVESPQKGDDDANEIITLEISDK
jgi:hypothetical protein